MRSASKKSASQNVVSTLVDTKTRLLEAAEVLFVQHGYEALLLRDITVKAKANLASVNYHFGDKDGLIRSLLAQRLEPLNERRVALLAACQQASDTPLSCEALLAVLFAPALELERSESTQLRPCSFIRFLCRVYSDGSPFIQQHLQDHYAPVFSRFFDAFAAALPELPRSELGLRLQFALKAISGVMASTELPALMDAISLGRPTSDSEVLAKLITLVAAAIKAPTIRTPAEHALETVLRLQRGRFQRGSPP